MSSILRRSLGCGLVAIMIVTGSNAAAEGRSPTATPGPVASATLSSLPSGRVPQPPRAKAPLAIPAREKVAGFTFTAQQKGADWIGLVPSAKVAKAVSEGNRSALAGEACFTEDGSINGFGRGFSLDEEGADAESAWRPNLQPVLSMSAAFQRGQRPAVVAVHSERMAEEGGKVSLEVVDAWVDPVTRGVRLIARSSVPLELVSTLLGDTKVYAARESQSIHLVLVAPKEQKRTGNEGIFAIADSSVFHSACDHIRVTLKAERGQGATSNIISNVVLPSLDPRTPEETKPEAAREGRAAPAEARVRPMHVHASLAWGSRDKEPALTISAGWDSRERTALVF